MEPLFPAAHLLVNFHRNWTESDELESEWLYTVNLINKIGVFVVPLQPDFQWCVC